MGQYWQGLLYQPDCHVCPLAHDRPVLPDGPIPTKLCFVGEGPGRVEAQEGRGFMGPSGELLWKLADAYGLDRKDVWVTNASLCFPRDVRLQSGTIIKMQQVKKLSIKACRKRLIWELMYVTGNDPSAVIVPIGGLALRALSTRKNAGIFQYRGSLQQINLQQLWDEAQRERPGW